MVRRFIDNQKQLCRKLDSLLPACFSIDGNAEYADSFARRWIRPGDTIYDIGGGKQPLLSPAERAQLGLRIVGVDIDQQELSRAPKGAYDEIRCADITGFEGSGDADVVLCQALLEHVPNVEAALAAIASILKPGGRAVIFVPSRNAVFARLNLLLPERLKRRILFAVHPAARKEQGFPAFYASCTPKQFKRIIRRIGLDLEEARFYYISSYFSFFFPLYALWRAWILMFFLVDREASAETFSMILRRPC